MTTKIAMFLSRLNEISGDCEKIVLVSGSLCMEELKILQNNDFDCMVVWMKGNCEWRSLILFLL